MMPLAASVNSMGEVSTNGEAMQQQHTQHMHQMAYNASATQAMAGHASLEQQQQQQHIQPAGTGFQQVAGPGSGLTHMQGSSMQPMDANTSMQHDGVSVAALSMPGPPAGHQPATAFPYTGESMQPAPPQPQQQQQQQQAVNASTFVYDPSQSQPSSSSSLAPQLSFAHTSQPPHFQQQLTGVTQQQQPGSSSNSNTPQQASNPFAVHHQHDPSSAPPTTTTSPRSSPTMSTSNLDTPTVGSSMSGPFAFPTGTPTSSTSNSSLNAPAGSVASTNSAPATSAGSGPFANVSAPAVKSRTATTISNGSSTSNTNNGQSSTLGNGIINTASTTSAPARASAGTGAEVVQQPSQQQQQQQTMQQNMQSQHQHQQEPSSLLSSAAVDSLPSSTPADAQPSASGLTLGQMDPQFALRQQLQQMPAQNQSQPLSATQPLMVHEQLSSAQGQELAVKACADVSVDSAPEPPCFPLTELAYSGTLTDTLASPFLSPILAEYDDLVNCFSQLSNSYNKIADVLRQYTSVDMATRIRMRQDFCNSVSALDRAFFCKFCRCTCNINCCFHRPPTHFVF